MEKLEKYQKILTAFVEEYAKAPFSVQKDLENQAITDTIHNHFQVVTIGWDKGTFVYNPVFHFDIRDGKIWIQQNWTELSVVEELMAKGVEKQDIVLGFVPPYARIHTGFAAA